MDRIIYSYALIKSLYDHGEDLTDSFLPIIISVIPVSNFISIKSISDNIKTKYDSEIPLHVLESLLKKARRRLLIEAKRYEKLYRVTERGTKYRSKFESEHSVERRITALLIDIEKFFAKRNLEIKRDEIYKILYSFLANNIKYLKTFLNPSISDEKAHISKFKTKEKALLDYIKIAQNEKPSEFKVFEELVYGSIISTILYSKTPSDMYEIGSRKFRECTAFLDTNFIFSLLELHPEDFSEPAKELFELLKKFGFKTKIFDFTITEICILIAGYAKEQHKYTKHLSVDTIYSEMKKKGWSVTDAKEFIIHIEEKLMSMGIEVEWTKEPNLKRVKLRREDLQDIISVYKPDRPQLSRKHDLLAIEKIEEIRGRPVRKIEYSKAFFLSEDIKLGKFDFIELGHRDSFTVCEVILDKLLTNILWLKYPSIKLPLKTIIAANSAGLFIKKRVWDRFYEILHNLKIDQKVDDTQIGMLIYHHNIDDALREFDDEEIYDITPDFILEKAKEATKEFDEIKRKEIQQKEKEFIQLLDRKVSETAESKDKEWFKRIKKIKDNARRNSEKLSNKIINSIKIVLALLLLFVGIFCVLLYGWDVFNNFASTCSFLAFLFLFLVFRVEKIWGSFKAKLTKCIYLKLAKKLDFDLDNE